MTARLPPTAIGTTNPGSLLTVAGNMTVIHSV
jgi:hypothetical protein